MQDWQYWLLLLSLWLTCPKPAIALDIFIKGRNIELVQVFMIVFCLYNIVFK